MATQTVLPATTKPAARPTDFDVLREVPHVA